MRLPAGYDSSNYEDYSDEDLAEEVSFLKNHLSHCEDMLDSGEYDYDEYLEDHISALKDELALISAEITRRLPVEAPVKVVAKAEPDVSPAPASKPSPEFCAALVASGNYSDCGWAFTQTQ